MATFAAIARRCSGVADLPSLPRKTAHVQRAEQLVNREDFPPDIEFEMGRIWKTEKVRRWAETRGRELHE